MVAQATRAMVMPKTITFKSLLLLDEIMVLYLRTVRYAVGSGQPRRINDSEVDQSS